LAASSSARSRSGTITIDAQLPNGSWTVTTATQGAVSYDANGVPTQGAWTITLPHNIIGISVVPGTLTVTVDWGADGTIDRTWTFTNADRLRADLAQEDNTLHLRFLSPTRLEEKDRLFRAPDFAVLFRRLLYRIDDLARNFAGGARRDRAELDRLHAAADRVRLVDCQVHWVEQWSWSGRKESLTPVGGFVGTAAYRSDDWADLLPWLLLGQGTHVGKLPVKGNGVYEVAGRAEGYWAWAPPPLPSSLTPIP